MPTSTPDNNSRLLFTAPQLSLAAGSQQAQDFRLQSLTQLQTTLDIEHIIQIFFAQLKQRVDLSSCHFQQDTPAVDVSLGKAARHRCRYELSLNGESFGHISFSHYKRISEPTLAFIESVMDVLIYPLRNGLMHRRALETAMIDPLTGLGNRAAMSLTLNRDIERARRHQQEMSVLMVDIDHFKQLNDRYGHLTGDDVLRQVSSVLQATIRGSDACFRFGGEEFLVLLTNSNLAKSIEVGERLRQKIKTNTRSPDVNKPVTVSLGVAHYHNESDWASLVNRADQALYQAKRAGRDQVVQALPPNTSA